MNKIDLTGLPTHQKLQIWADLLEAVPSYKLKMNSWYDSKLDKLTPDLVIDDCGTSACAWGWAAVFFEGFEIDSNNGYHDPVNNGDMHPTVQCSELFGITYDESKSILFAARDDKRKILYKIRRLADHYKKENK